MKSQLFLLFIFLLFLLKHFYTAFKEKRTEHNGAFLWPKAETLSINKKQPGFDRVCCPVPTLCCKTNCKTQRSKIVSHIISSCHFLLISNNPSLALFFEKIGIKIMLNKLLFSFSHVSLVFFFSHWCSFMVTCLSYIN